MDRYERGLGKIADLEGQLEIAKDRVDCTDR
jgi:hypothetical protein